MSVYDGYAYDPKYYDDLMKASAYDNGLDWSMPLTFLSTAIEMTIGVLFFL